MAESDTDNDAAIAALHDALAQAQAAAAVIDKRIKKLIERGRFAEANELNDEHAMATTARTLATRLLGRAIMNPSGPKVQSLKGATKELEDRIADFKAGAADMNDLAHALSILTSAITVFGLL